MRPDRSNFLNQCHNSGAENQKVDAGPVAMPIWKPSSQSLNALGFFVPIFRAYPRCRSPPFRDLETNQFSNSRRET